MTPFNRSSRWAAALALGLAGLIGCRRGARARRPARTAASPFELVFQGRWEWDAEDGYGLHPDAAVLVGTFTSGAPFCESGTAAQKLRESVRRYTCSDDSGSLTLVMMNPDAAGANGRSSRDPAAMRACMAGGPTAARCWKWIPSTVHRSGFGRRSRGSLIPTPSRGSIRTPSRRAPPRARA